MLTELQRHYHLLLYTPCDDGASSSPFPRTLQFSPFSALLAVLSDPSAWAPLPSGFLLVHEIGGQGGRLEDWTGENLGYLSSLLIFPNGCIAL